MMNPRVIDVALGNAPADIVIQNGTLVNVNTRELYQADISVVDGLIASVGVLAEGAIGPGTRVMDASAQYLCPGFIDAHIHFESSMLSFTEFTKAVLLHGTTAVASDLMEIAIVAGKEGILDIFREAEGLPLHLLYPVPAFMSEEGSLQTIGAALYPELVEELLKLPTAVGLAEVLYPPILEKSPVSAQMLAAAQALGKTAEGHAPALLGTKLDAYASAGIRSDHESTSREEALDKARKGLRILMREGCAAQDLEACLQIITQDKVDSRMCSMVSDDIDMLHIWEKGHLDHKVRMAVKAGVDPVVAIQMVTLNPAESLKVDDRYGSITPGKCADIVLLDDLATCSVSGVIVGGAVVVEERRVAFTAPAFQHAACMLNTARLQKPVCAEDLMLRVDPATSTARVRVIGANGTTLLTEALEADLAVADGWIQPDLTQDILHIACVERYGKNGNIGHSFIKGFQLSRGAIATSMGHDHHNITTVGTNAADMALAVNRVAELSGGLVIADNGVIVCELALPICGLLCQLSIEESATILAKMQKELAARGCHMASPYMTLAFLTLIYIPMYGITDRGLVDVLNFKVIDTVIS